MLKVCIILTAQAIQIGGCGYVDRLWLVKRINQITPSEIND